MLKRNSKDDLRLFMVEDGRRDLMRRMEKYGYSFMIIFY